MTLTFDPLAAGTGSFPADDPTTLKLPIPTGDVTPTQPALPQPTPVTTDDEPSSGSGQPTGDDPVHTREPAGWGTRPQHGGHLGDLY